MKCSRIRAEGSPGEQLVVDFEDFFSSPNRRKLAQLFSGYLRPMSPDTVTHHCHCRGEEEWAGGGLWLGSLWSIDASQKSSRST